MIPMDSMANHYSPFQLSCDPAKAVLPKWLYVADQVPSRKLPRILRKVVS